MEKSVAGVCVLLAIFWSAEVRGNEWFDAIQERETPIYFCPPHDNVEGLNFKFPTLPDCTPPDTKMKSTLVNVTTFWPDASWDTYVGKECWKETYTNVKKSWCLFMCKSTLSKQNYHVETVTQDECRLMNSSKTTPHGNDELELISQGHFGTKNHVIPEAGYFTDASHVNVNYNMMDIRMSVDPVSGAIKTIGTTPQKQCLIDVGECPASRGVLVWNRQIHKSCRIAIGKTTPCLRTGDHISCPQFSLQFVGWTTVEMCGIKVARANGSEALFVIDTPNELANGIGGLSEIYSHIKDRIPNRSGGLGVESFPIVHQQQNAAHLQFLSSVMDERRDSAINSVHTDICRLNRLQLEMHVRNAAVGPGDVSPLVQSLTGNPAYR